MPGLCPKPCCFVLLRCHGAQDEHFLRHDRTMLSQISGAVVVESPDCLSHVKGICHRPSQRLIHIGDQRDHASPHTATQLDLAWAKIVALSWVFTKATLPVFTSRTIALLPAASLLLPIGLTMKGFDSTMPVTTRSVYSLPSAGARSHDWPLRTAPICPSCVWKPSLLRSIRKPGIDSSLSTVPP